MTGEEKTQDKREGGGRVREISKLSVNLCITFYDIKHKDVRNTQGCQKVLK